MSPVDSADPCSDVRPDYAGGGILNLMASIVAARGGEPWHPTLRLLPPEDIVRVSNLVLLVVDGLGDPWLRAHSPGGLLARNRIGWIGSVFPSTTATAITTFLTAEAPLRHGLTGWHTWLGELGCVMAVLPGTPRYGGLSYRQAGIDTARLFGDRPVFRRISTRSIAVTPSRIADSDFNRAHTLGAEVRAFRNLKEMLREIARAIRWDRRPKYIYAYWPELDSIGHAQGMESPAAEAHLLALESELAPFLDSVAGRDVALVVCADHGQVDCAPGLQIDLAEHPGLADCLALPLCGEPRAAFAYLRSGRESAFLEYCRGPLAGLVQVRSSAELRAEGWFGRGEAHPRFDERIGDWCLLPTGNRVVRQALPFENRHPLVGQHGGVSPAEMQVPLCLFRP